MRVHTEAASQTKVPKIRKTKSHLLRHVSLVRGLSVGGTGCCFYDLCLYIERERERERWREREKDRAREGDRKREALRNSLLQ